MEWKEKSWKKYSENLTKNRYIDSRLFNCNCWPSPNFLCTPIFPFWNNENLRLESQKHIAPHSNFCFPISLSKHFRQFQTVADAMINNNRSKDNKGKNVNFCEIHHCKYKFFWSQKKCQGLKNKKKDELRYLILFLKIDQ